MLSQDSDGMDSALVIQPDVAPAHYAIDILVNNARAINAQSLAMAIHTDMNRLCAPIRVVVLKHADVGDNWHAGPNKVSTFPEKVH